MGIYVIQKGTIDCDKCNKELAAISFPARDAEALNICEVTCVKCLNKKDENNRKT